MCYMISGMNNSNVLERDVSYSPVIFPYTDKLGLRCCASPKSM